LGQDPENIKQHKTNLSSLNKGNHNHEGVPLMKNYGLNFQKKFPVIENGTAFIGIYEKKANKLARYLENFQKFVSWNFCSI